MQNCLSRYLFVVATVLTLHFSSHSHNGLYAETVKFVLPGNSMGYLPLFVAVHRGFFKDEGIDIELPRLVPAMAHNALLAGEAQYHGLADSGLRLAAKGLPLKAIFFGADRPMY
jgi:ABC-type nitrate/sulfonate/bicarbonate transport system substrate-binding protein